MSQQKLFSKSEMAKVMHQDREDYGEKKSMELLQSKKYQARNLAKKGYSVALIAKLLKLSHRAVTGYLIDK